MKNGRQRGFTLIELMVVVAIVGILAILAVIGYRKIVNSSRLAEPRQMVGSIRAAQEGYKAETGTYAPIHGNSRPADTEYCPNKMTGVGFNSMKKMGWALNCPVAASGGPTGPMPFGTIPVHADGEVMYGYATAAGPPGSVALLPPASELAPPAGWPASSTSDWFVVYAKGDTDNNGVLGVVVGHSFSRELFFREE